MRRAPEIVFRIDRGMAQGGAVLNILDSLEAERKLREKWADEDLARTKASVMHIIS